MNNETIIIGKNQAKQSPNNSMILGKSGSPTKTVRHSMNLRNVAQSCKPMRKASKNK